MKARALRLQDAPAASTCPADPSSLLDASLVKPVRSIADVAEQFDVAPGDIASALMGVRGLEGNAYRAAAQLTAEERAVLLPPRPTYRARFRHRADARAMAAGARRVLSRIGGIAL